MWLQAEARAEWHCGSTETLQKPRTLQGKLPGADIDTDGNGRCSRALSDSLSQSGQEEETYVGADSEHELCSSSVLCLYPYLGGLGY